MYEMLLRAAPMLSKLLNTCQQTSQTYKETSLKAEDPAVCCCMWSPGQGIFWRTYAARSNFSGRVALALQEVIVSSALYGRRAEALTSTRAAALEVQRNDGQAERALTDGHLVNQR